MNEKLLRLKKNTILRNMCAETSFLGDQLIQPIFISEKAKDKIKIPGLGENFVFNIDDAIRQIESDAKNDCRNFLLFLIPSNKSEFDFNLSFHSQAILKLKTILRTTFFYGQMFVCAQ